MPSKELVFRTKWAKISFNVPERPIKTPNQQMNCTRLETSRHYQTDIKRGIQRPRQVKTVPKMKQKE